MTEPEYVVIESGRRNGKRKALEDAVNARLREGWTEITAEPASGVRMFAGPPDMAEPGGMDDE